MTTYNTGNPLPSADAKDRYDNSQTFDELINSPAPFAATRLGAALKTWAGMLNQFSQTLTNFNSQFNAFLDSQGFVDIGEYDSGPLTITAANQMFRKDGAYWSPSPALALPYTTLNNWAADKHNFVNRGDGAVRTQLAEVTANLDAAADKIVVDLHYGICRGTGYNGTGGERVTTASTAFASGKQINVVDSTGFVPGQLIVYVGDDGEYYTSVINTVSGSALLLQSSLEASISVGALVGIYYTDRSHPTVMGYRANADALIRQASKKYQVVRTWRPGDESFLIGGATSVSLSGSVYNNPGSPNSPSISITGVGVGSGLSIGPFKLPQGDYAARVFLTPNLNGGAGVLINVTESVGAISFDSFGEGPSPTVRDLYFRKSKNGTVSVNITALAAGQNFAVSRVEIVRITSTIRSLDRGVHVLFGDSWFAAPGFFERYSARLPNATIINKGVGGNTASHLVARFDADVRPYNPTFVVVNVGTNDAALGVAASDFFANCGIISQQIQSTQATGIFFNCSVGAPDHPDFGDLLARSREYVIHEDYVAEFPGFSGVETLKLPINIDVPAGGSARMLIPGFVQKAVTFKKLYVVGQGGEVTGDVRLGYASGLTAILEAPVTFAWENAFRSNIAVAKADAGTRFPMLEFRNSGGTEVAVGGYFELEWTPIIG